MSESAERRIAELERALEADPGGSAFPALCERLRRAGRLDEALRVCERGLEARPDSAAGRALYLLILDDQGRAADAREHLERWAAEALDGGVELEDDEFEQAFENAEPELDAMITPDSVAEEAALRVDGGVSVGYPLEESGAFATHTMADLLERQGDRAGAARIRAALDAPSPPTETRSDDDPRTRTIDTLERWLDNLRRPQP